MRKLIKLSLLMTAFTFIFDYSLQAGYQSYNFRRSQIAQTDTQTTTPTTTNQNQASSNTTQNQTQVNPDLKASQDAALAWLALVDKGQYGDSWDQGAPLFQQTLNRSDWIQVLQATRQPLGNAQNRTLLDIRTAYNPPGLPAGDYMVIFYKTNFDSKSGAYELLTLRKQPDGKWKVLTYAVD